MKVLQETSCDESALQETSAPLQETSAPLQGTSFDESALQGTSFGQRELRVEGEYSTDRQREAISHEKWARTV